MPGPWHGPTWPPAHARVISALLVLQALISSWIILHFDGTGDAGDSIMHYLFARYAPAHPALYFDHWAKPLFVLLASPFAQFGLTGMKAFNALCALGITWSTYRTAQGLGLKRPWIVAVMLMSMPVHVALTFSGLTEPLFALLLIAGVQLAVARRPMAAAALISWLPFVRSEGLLVIGGFGLYFLLRRQWRSIPWLLLGTLVYAIAGSFISGDVLWVFNRIPYAQLASSYGSGPPFHFVEQLLYVVGVPLYILFWVGLLGQLLRWRSGRLSAGEGWLVLAMTVVYITAHSLFWALGIFHSMGLNRVLIGIAPLLAITSARGLEHLAGGWLKSRPVLQRTLFGLLLVYVVIFPFTSNPAALHVDQELLLTNDQRLAQEVASFIRSERPAHGRILYAHPYLGEALGLDPFDHAQHAPLAEALGDGLRPDDLVVWENWFAVVEAGIPLEALKQDARLERLLELHATDRGRAVTHVVFGVRAPDP